MTPEKIFSFCNAMALLSWIILIFLPFWKNRVNLLFGIVVIALALVYSWLIFSTISPAGFKDFGSLDGITKLFANKYLLAAGWIHYLAFDLSVGIYIVTNARKHQINHWLTVPSLFFTFMLGPFGLLTYYLLRLFKTKQYFRDNF